MKRMMMARRACLAATAVALTMGTAGTSASSAQATDRTPGTVAQRAIESPGTPQHAPKGVNGLTSNGHRMSPACATNWINIGSPGNFNWHGQYAGQVEQMYDTCSGNVEAHWQWAGGFQSAHPGAWVTIDAAAVDPQHVYVDSWTQAQTYTKDVYTQWGVNIHSPNPNPDTWFTDAYVTVGGSGCGNVAYGSQHIYATGGTGFGASTGGC